MPGDIVITYDHNYLKELDGKINSSGYRYGPCKVPQAKLTLQNEVTIQELYERRIACLSQLKFEAVRQPNPGKGYDHKICVAISVGCPVTLTDTNYLKQLHWYSHADDRPTFLLIHECELEAYQKFVAPSLGKVGLATWNCGNAAGFGLTRRAAQLLSYKLRPSYELVMCDSHVISNDELSGGYVTDEEERRRREDPLNAHFSSPGLGEAKPSGTWGIPHRDLLSTTGRGRPIEQVTVTSARKYFFDPAFITSNEDMALTALRYPDATDWLNHKKEAKIRKYPLKDKKGDKKKEKTIEKETGLSYEALRKKYLEETLAVEDDVCVIYQWPGAKTEFTQYRMSLGDLTTYLHGIHPSRDRAMVRSTIIEVILVAWLKKSITNKTEPHNPLTASNANWPTNTTSSISIASGKDDDSEEASSSSSSSSSSSLLEEDDD